MRRLTESAAYNQHSHEAGWTAQSDVLSQLVVTTVFMRNWKVQAAGMVAAPAPGMISIASSETNPGYALEMRAEPRTRRVLREDVRTAVASGRQRIVIDCTNWSELDLPLLSVLIQCARECETQGVELEIVNLSLQIRANIEALRLDHQLGLH